MKRIWPAGLALVVLAGACSLPEARTATVTPQPAVQPAPPPANGSFIPAGTVFTARLDTKLSTDDSKVGDTFTASVVNPLVATNGEVVVPAGATLTGLVTGIGATNDQSAIRLNFTRIDIEGTNHPISANIISTHQLDAKRDTEDIARAAAVGGAVGAVLGAIIGEGSVRDILIGGALGAGAGTVISLGKGDVAHELPAGTQLTVQTTDRVELR